MITSGGGNELRGVLTSLDYTNPNSRLTNKPSLVKKNAFFTQQVSPARTKRDVIS